MASSEAFVAGYRIVAPHWAASAFSGEGAAKYGGRWNPAGTRVVYLAGSRALAALEMLVHLPGPLSRAKPYVILEAHVPKAAILDAPQAQDPIATGVEWLASGRSLALKVPSHLVPEEPNYLVNPNHPEMRGLRIGAPVGFHFDPRL